MSSARKHSLIHLPSLQSALDLYFEGRAGRIQSFVQTQLKIQDCYQLQKRHFFKDVLKNPVNALWAIPYFSIRKAVETSEKLGWDKGAIVFAKIPASFKTDFQKEIERMIAVEVFGLSSERGNVCELSMALQQTGLKESLEEHEWQQLLSLARSQVRSCVSEFCAKQNGFTDLVSSGGLVLVSELLFKDRSMDIFAIGRKIASLWAKNEATSKFAFGKTLGRAFYSVAPPPAPTTTQVIITTGLGILLLALFSTTVGVLSHPLQVKLGFRQRQLENLLDTVNGKLLIELTRCLKKHETVKSESLKTL